MGKSLTTKPCRQIQMYDWIRNRNETCLDLPSGTCRQRTSLSPAGANSPNCNLKPALSRRQRQKTVQAATVNKSLQFRRCLRDFFAPVWGLPLVAVYVPVHDKIRSEGFAVAANISRRSGGAFKQLTKWFDYRPEQNAITTFRPNLQHSPNDSPMSYIWSVVHTVVNYNSSQRLREGQGEEPGGVCSWPLTAI